MERCLLKFKQTSGADIHHNFENSTRANLMYTMDSINMHSKSEGLQFFGAFDKDFLTLIRWHHVIYFTVSLVKFVDLKSLLSVSIMNNKSYGQIIRESQK